jgi:hypothetical protein
LVITLIREKKSARDCKAQVVGKSFEPKVQYHLAMIYKANNEIDRVAPIKEELLVYMN